MKWDNVIFVIESGLDWKLSESCKKKSVELGTRMRNNGYDKEDSGVYEW